MELGTSEIGLEKVVGEAAVVDLSSLGAEAAIQPDHLDTAGAHIEAGDIALLKTNWDTHESHNTLEYWTRSPYVTREACEWLLERKIRAVGYDFPQDFALRKMLAGENPPLSEFVTHDVLLRGGVIMIEYLCNMSPITSPRVEFFALPLKILDSDGAPARVIALDG